MKIDDRAYPLYWPEGVKRTAPGWRKSALFKGTTIAGARDRLFDELGRLGAANFVLSTNYSLSARSPADPGAAVYFELAAKPRVMACDRWQRLEHNIHALGLTVEAMRAIERWGSSDFIERAFTGFTALQPAEHDWRSVFGLASPSTPRIDLVKDVYRQLALSAHPDRGGSTESMARLNAAMEAAERELAPRAG